MELTRSLRVEIGVRYWSEELFGNSRLKPFHACPAPKMNATLAGLLVDRTVCSE
jgi:hypothetical protein